MAATLCTEEVAATVTPGEHGTTFGGAPLAAAAVLATLAIIDEDDLMGRAAELGRCMHRELSVPGVLEMRGNGAWCALVLDRPARPVMHALRERGFLLGTSTDPRVLRLAPPAVMPVSGVHLLADALAEVLASSTADRGAA